MKFLIYLVALVIYCNALTFASEPLCDAWFTATVNPRAVVILTHGMNLKPSCMDQMAREFSQAGFEVLRPAFSGHCGDNKKYLEVAASDWEADARRIYSVGKARAKGLKKPLYLVGYSFSPVVFEALGDELLFDKKIYLAPALSPKFWFPALRFLAKTFPWVTYDSRVPAKCAANQVAGARPILALDHFLERLSSTKAQEVPTLVVAEPYDELVSYDGLQEYAKSKKTWLMESISNAGATIPHPYHHMIISPEAVGGTEWSKLMKESLEFLRKPMVK